MAQRLSNTVPKKRHSGGKLLAPVSDLTSSVIKLPTCRFNCGAFSHYTNRPVVQKSTYVENADVTLRETKKVISTILHRLQAIIQIHKLKELRSFGKIQVEIKH